MLRPRALGAALMAAVAIWGVAREAAGQPVAPKKYALLIGMNTYSNGFITGKVPELKWAVDDAKALAAALTDLGYDTTVIPKTEATRRRIIEALNYFATKATENDSDELPSEAGIPHGELSLGGHPGDRSHRRCRTVTFHEWRATQLTDPVRLQ